ncbi:hypothetical protein M3898_001035 [Vibrio metschnikovii]|uniref:Uncharacterized protein n=2 Tax=Unclassified Bacteria TaxID=49928 RepID=A0AAU6UR69_UNCXX|nr:hypothetical protein [Vibrio metschnikovii]EKO3640929.1 hypothetical protein [Vibrio metschnikovii]EKO3698011.1 hypothetical protein [Vibrio metschnikovii]
MALNFNSHSHSSTPSTVRVQVKADKGSQETWWVLGSMLLILLVSALLLRGMQVNNTPQTSPLSFELHATDLNEKQKSLLIELSLAEQELRFFHHLEHQWPSVQWLAEEGIAPFVRDSSWHYLGEHQWQQVAQGYLGLAQDPSQVGHVLIWYPEGPDADAQVWFFTQPIVGELSDWLALTDSSWIQAGWKRWPLSASLSH